MIVFEALPVLLIATAIWILWRLVLWRRNGGDPIREVVVGALFVWSLVMVQLTFFPMVIVFYDWHSRVNLIPFASIRQLLAETTMTTAFVNIVGNLLLFVPLGYLLPTLFTRLRSPWPLLWRVAVISAAIEAMQIFTRARALDVDDVTLNVVGATIGYGAFKLTVVLLERSTSGTALLDRLGATPNRDPLLSGVVPIGLTLLIAVPMAVNAIVDSTLDETGIAEFATAEWPQGEVVVRADIAEHTYLVASDGDEPAPGLRLVVVENVLPGRYTWVSSGDLSPGIGSRYVWGITAFNVDRGEIPTVFVWGSNADAATAMIVSGNGIQERIPIPPGDQFVVGFPYDVEANVDQDGILDDFDFQFLDEDGNDVSNSFEQA